MLLPLTSWQMSGLRRIARPTYLGVKGGADSGICVTRHGIGEILHGIFTSRRKIKQSFTTPNGTRRSIRMIKHVYAND